MPLLEINQTRYISASVRLDESTAEQVDQYAAFVHASADDVVDKALNYVFSKDRDFQDFLKTPQAKQVASTLRVRKAPTNASAEEPTKKLVSGVECHNSSGAKHRSFSGTKLNAGHAFTARTEAVDSTPATSFLAGFSAAPLAGPLRTRNIGAICLACGVFRKSWKSRSFEKT